jgi:hypothetical protein
VREDVDETPQSFKLDKVGYARAGDRSKRAGRGAYDRAPRNSGI